MHNVTTKIMSEDKIDDKWCHYSGMPSPSFYMNDDKWNMIPSQCEYDGKIFRILNIDMQGGYFTLQDLEAKKGDVQVIEVDMLDCNVV